MGSKEEPEKKRRHANNTISSPPKKQNLSSSSSDEKKVDTTELQIENHKLAQQLDAQRNEFHVLETKFGDLRFKQKCYDENLAYIRNAWQELIDNLELLLVRANGPVDGLQILEPSNSTKGAMDALVPPEEMFLKWFLYSSTNEYSGINNNTLSLEKALVQRESFTEKLVEGVLQATEHQRTQNEDYSLSLKKGMSPEEYGQLSDNVIQDTKKEIQTLKLVIELLHGKHDGLLSEIKLCQDEHVRNQSELSRLKGELEEAVADLETSRRKLASMRSQKESILPITNMLISGTRDAISKESRELESSLEETKNMASQRFNEVKEAQKEKMLILEEILKQQESLTDENHILSSLQYLALVEEAQCLKAELQQYEALVNEAQAEHDSCIRQEKEALLELDSKEASEKVKSILKLRMSELETSLSRCSSEVIELQKRVDKASLSSERNDEVAQFKLVVSTLHKEMRMMQQQLNQHKQSACGSYSLTAEVQSLNSVLDRKKKECKNLEERVSEQTKEINAMKEEVRLLRESEEELKLILDMYGRESVDSREVRELRQAECRAWAQVERLKTAIDEHSLEVKVKQAIEAEAACQQKLAAAEAEIADLRQKIDVSDRDAIDASEMLRMKSEEGDAYLAEIETIGQAYEDMQTQNQRLLQQISERDDYNLKLIFESFRAKQAQVSLNEEKKVLTDHLKYISALGENFKLRAVRLEEQVCVYSEQIAKTIDESRQHINALEQARRKFMDAERELASCKSSLLVAQNELEKQRTKIMDAEIEFENERFERKRVQEELAVLSVRASRLSRKNEEEHLIEKLQEEIKDYKEILRCSVCNNRSKEVVVTKCFHLFCGPCVQKIVESRHRKCPTCGVVFGQNDVRNVYI